MASKFLKDVLFLAFLILSLRYLQWPSSPSSHVLIIPALFTLLIFFAFFRSMHDYGIEVALLGLRPFAFLLVLGLGSWLVSSQSFALLSRYLLLALILELILAVYENSNGVPLFFNTRIGNRVTGTFSLPASLGIFAVFAYAFTLTFSNLSKVLLTALVIPLVYLTGSGTAFLLLYLVVGTYALRSVPHAWKAVSVFVLITVLALILLALPKLTSRPDLYNSLTGRTHLVQSFFQHPPEWTTFLFGKGLGVGSNIVNLATAYTSVIPESVVAALPRATSDSTPMALIHQMGIIGALLFYSMLITAAWRDPRALPIYAVLFLASITVNLTELFPVNFLMGLLLCRSLMCVRNADTTSLTSA